MAKKISNSLVTLSSAAILAIYAAGYERTTPAANRFAAEMLHRRAPMPAEAAALLPAMPGALAGPADIRADHPTEPQRATTSLPAAVAPKKTAPGEQAPAGDNAPAVSISNETAVNHDATPTAEPAAEPASGSAVQQTEHAPSYTEHAPSYKDGVYLGWGYSRHGNIQAFVRIEGGRIVHAGIQRCETRWPCDLVAHLPPQVIARQSAEVDYVTGATQSGDAFYGAIVAALAQAR